MRSKKAGIFPAFFLANFLGHLLSMQRFPMNIRFVSLAVLIALSGPAFAAEPALTLIEGEKFSITSQDIQADSLRMPMEMRSIVLAKPQTVTQIASNLYVRRAMAQQAELEAMEKDPAVAAALRVARDKVLSDLWMEKMDRLNEPKSESAESLARANYKAKPERFKVDEQVRARHILIAGKEAAARAQAEKVLEEIKAGADFAKLAAERSADKGSAAKGGDLGFFGRGKMVPEFEAAVFALQATGDLSGVVESQFGYHIIQLQEKKPASIRSFEEVKDELIKEVSTNVKHEARVAYAQKVQQGMKVNVEAIEGLANRYSAAAPTSVQRAQQPVAK
ncbi:peptidylprolyl isomerase [Acidovorax temperans]|uniref:peptidylprolyl isomerase n=1 Tax=Acidovorax temperans TaxID=80878 RepID=UPI00289C7A45|nr:peptidylprolyl isomerase [Acidovorax temperans]